MRALRVLGLAAACVLAALPVSADAPSDQYESFQDVTTSIKDRFTMLRWERRPPDTGLTFEEAADFCAKKAAPRGGQYRLPTVKELLTLVDEEPHQEYEDLQNVTLMIDDAAFPKTPHKAQFWSQSMAAPTQAWTVDFSDGTMGKANTEDDARFVRCVVYEPPP